MAGMRRTSDEWFLGYRLYLLFDGTGSCNGQDRGLIASVMNRERRL